MSSTGMKVEPLYVVDTHTLIWYLVNDKRLSQKASEIFDAAERGETRLVLSAVVFAELYYANRKHKWFTDFNTAYRRIKSKPFSLLSALRPVTYWISIRMPPYQKCMIASLQGWHGDLEFRSSQ